MASRYSKERSEKPLFTTRDVDPSAEPFQHTGIEADALCGNPNRPESLDKHCRDWDKKKGQPDG